jgi:hypothetical protein
MKSLFQKLSLILGLAISAFCAHAEEWKSRTIYQLLTDRFYKPGYKPPKPNPGPYDVCPNLRHYCGGNY